MHAHFRVCKPPKSSYKNNVLKRFPHTFGRLSTVKGNPDPSTWYSALTYRHAEDLVIVCSFFIFHFYFSNYSLLSDAHCQLDNSDLQSPTVLVLTRQTFRHFRNLLDKIARPNFVFSIQRSTFL